MALFSPSIVYKPMNQPTIVCVNAEKMVLHRLGEQLKRHFSKNYGIQLVESGKAALNLFSRSTFQGSQIALVICDQILPDMTGDELLALLHLHQSPETVKILLTSQVNPEIINRAIAQANLYRYLTQPWDEIDLILTVKEALYCYMQDQQIKALQTYQPVEVTEQKTFFSPSLELGQLSRETQDRTDIVILGNYTCFYNKQGFSEHFCIEQDLEQKTKALKAFSHSLKHLHRLTLSHFATCEELFAEYIKTGREVLNFTAGMIGRIDTQYYTVKAVQSDFNSLVPNLMIDIDCTFCIEVARQKKTLSYCHIGAMEQFQNHPIYQTLKLESYISTPIFLDGEVYGTLCFFCTEPRKQGFENHEREIIELMAQSIGKFMTAYHAETALKESEERFRRAFEDAGIGMALVGLDGRWLQVNRSFCLMLGYSESEFFETNIQALLHPDDLLLNLTEFEQLLAEDHQTSCTEKRFIHKQGHLVWGLVNTSLLRDSTKAPLYYIAQIQDITERKQREEEIVKREQYLAVLVQVQRQLLTYSEHHHFYSGILALLGEVSQADRVYLFENHYSKTGQLLTSQRSEWCADGVQPEIDNPGLQNISYHDSFPRWLEVLSLGGIINGSVATFPDSERLILEPQGILAILILPLIVKGKFFGFIGFDNCREAREWNALEVSLLSAAASAISLSQEHYQAEKALRQSEAHNRALLEAIPDLMLQVRRDGTCLDLRFPKGAEGKNYLVFKEHIKEVLPPDLLKRQLEYIELALKTGELQVYEHQFLKNDQMSYEEVHISACGEDEVLIMVRDVSVAKHREAERKLSEAKLKASLQEKEILLQEIHHRVKNNLHIISNLLDLQSDALEDERLQSLFTDSQNRIQSMALIHEQLYQSKNLARVDFGQYVSRLLENLFSSYRETIQNIEPVIDIQPIQLNLQTAILCGLLINELVTNTFKHAFPNNRSGMIQIRLYQDDDEQLHLLVQDNGVGFNRDLNWQSASTLGLRLVQLFARQLRAKIETNFNDGTTFSLHFKPLKHPTQF